MAVQFDESNFFKFVIISDNKPKPSKNNNFTEKPSKDKKDKEQKEQKDNNMSTTSSPSPPPNNEKLNEKKENSQEENKSPEIKIDDIPKSNGDSTKEPKEQKNEEKSSRLTIDVPSKSTSPQYVTSPSDIRAKTPEPVSPSSNIFKNVSKKLGNMMKNSENGTTPEQEEVATSESKVQLQQEQQVVNNTVASDITKNTVDTARSIEDKKQEEDKKKDENKKNEDKKDEDKKDEDKKVEDKKDEIKSSTSESTAAKQRTGSLPNLVNMKMFITRSSSLFVDRLKKGFDNLDRKMYPDMEPEWVEENQSRETAISEREQLLGNKDVEITNGKSQESQSTQSVMAEIGEALNERQERLNNLGEKTEELSNHATDFAALASQIRKNQEQKKSWFW